MIIELEKARQVDKTLTREALTGYETAIRSITNNSFNQLATRKKIKSFSPQSLICFSDIEGIRAGDTIEINGSKFNDGLYTVKSVNQSELAFENADFYAETGREATVTKVVYPADVVSGLLRILEYEAKTRANVGDYLRYFYRNYQSCCS